MSKFCGKCDFADTIAIHCDRGTIEDFINTSDIYVGNNILPLKIESEKDLSAYYPFLESIVCTNKEHRHIVLHSKSFIDEEEYDRLKWALDRCLTVYKKYKRNKKPFEYSESLIKECFYFNNVSEYEQELLKRVCEDGLKATTEGLHTSIHDYYRKQWYEEMVRLGWEENKAYRWVYGWSRWSDKIVEERRKNNE